MTRPRTTACHAAVLLALAAPTMGVAQLHPATTATSTRPMTQPTFVAPVAPATRKLDLSSGFYHLTLNLPAHGQVRAWSYSNVVVIQRGASGIHMSGNDPAMTGTVTNDASGAVSIVIPLWRLTGTVTADGAAGDAVITEPTRSAQGTFKMVWFDPCPGGADANGQCN